MTKNNEPKEKLLDPKKLLTESEKILFSQVLTGKELSEDDMLYLAKYVAIDGESHPTRKDFQKKLATLRKNLSDFNRMSSKREKTKAQPQIEELRLAEKMMLDALKKGYPEPDKRKSEAEIELPLWKARQTLGYHDVPMKKIREKEEKFYDQYMRQEGELFQDKMYQEGKPIDTSDHVLPFYKKKKKGASKEDKKILEILIEVIENADIYHDTYRNSSEGLKKKAEKRASKTLKETLKKGQEKAQRSLPSKGKEKE